MQITVVQTRAPVEVDATDTDPFEAPTAIEPKFRSLLFVKVAAVTISAVAVAVSACAAPENMAAAAIVPVNAIFILFNIFWSLFL